MDLDPKEGAMMRSQDWYGGTGRDPFIHRAWMRRGVPDHAFDGRPQIAIANTASDLTPCNAHLNEVAEYVKQGVWEAGGVPVNLPVTSLGETLVKPTAMLWRNMAAMTIEEMLRANPIDAAVLLGGCDKTIPALLMGAASVDLPAVVVPGGPMLNGYFRGERSGCGTGVWALSEEVRAGNLSEQEFERFDKQMVRSKGHCNTMGTASTMGIMAEALGMTIRAGSRSSWLSRTGASRRSSRRSRSTTRSSPSPQSAARRTRSCTCSPSPAAWASTSPSRTSTASAGRSRCS
jgi:dihydroxy-acid dehydratase